jgi:hypothetical protein
MLTGRKSVSLSVIEPPVVQPVARHSSELSWLLRWDMIRQKAPGQSPYRRLSTHEHTPNHTASYLGRRWRGSSSRIKAAGAGVIRIYRMPGAMMFNNAIMNGRLCMITVV